MSNTKMTDNYIENMVKDNTKVHIFLANGIKLTGVITNYDDASILFKGDQLINRSQITTTQPATTD